MHLQRDGVRAVDEHRHRQQQPHDRVCAGEANRRVRQRRARDGSKRHVDACDLHCEARDDDGREDNGEDEDDTMARVTKGHRAGTHETCQTA
jgi:hypothetical protein